MSEPTWLTLLASSIGGGFVVKLFDYLHDELRRYRERTHTAKDLLTKHHDPILKAADELVGEIRSLAITDFEDFRLDIAGTATGVSSVRRTAAVFYVVQFWARLQLLKLETGYVALAAGPAGPRLQKFIERLESRSLRLVDRAWQRAAGEAILVSDGSARRPMNLFEFAGKYHSDEQFRAWFAPLSDLLAATAKHKPSRQRILKYGCVVHALIDAQDPKHVVTTKRDPWPHKLSPAVRKELAYGTFKAHLTFVEEPERYFASKKKGGPSEIAARALGERTDVLVGPTKIGD